MSEVDTSRDAVMLNLGYCRLPGRGQSIRVNRSILNEVIAQCVSLLSERDELLQALGQARDDVESVINSADNLGFHCVGCGHLCGDPEKDLKHIRKAGGISCCPERKMEPLSDTLRALQSTTTKEEE